MYLVRIYTTEIAWNKTKVLTREKSSIPTGFFLYTNMAADSLFCTQIWPLWRHINTIYRVEKQQQEESKKKNEIR